MGSRRWACVNALEDGCPITRGHLDSKKATRSSVRSPVHSGAATRHSHTRLGECIKWPSGMIIDNFMSNSPFKGDHLMVVRESRSVKNPTKLRKPEISEMLDHRGVVLWAQFARKLKYLTSELAGARGPSGLSAPRATHSHPRARFTFPSSPSNLVPLGPPHSPACPLLPPSQVRTLPHTSLPRKNSVTSMQPCRPQFVIEPVLDGAVDPIEVTKAISTRRKMGHGQPGVNPLRAWRQLGSCKRCPASFP